MFNLKSNFSNCDFEQIFRADNNHADSLANMGFAMEFQFKQVPVGHIPMPSIFYPNDTVHRLDASPGWREPIIEYLKYKTLPANKVEAEKMKHFAESYVIIEDDLYKSPTPSILRTLI